jgi:hypothetical protein
MKFKAIALSIPMLSIVGCEPVTSVAPASNSTASAGGTTSPLPQLGGGDANARIEALESYVQTLTTNYNSQIAQLQSQLNTVNAQFSSGLTASNTRTDQLTTRTTALETTTSQLTTQTNNMPATVCASAGGTFSNGSCTLAVPRILFENENILNCSMSSIGCLSNTIPSGGSAPSGTAVVSYWPDAPILIPAEGQTSDPRLKTFTVGAGQCRMIEVQVTAAAAMYWAREDNTQFSVLVRRNGADISPNANDKTEKFIGWAFNGWGVNNNYRPGFIYDQNPSAVNLFKRIQSGENEGDSSFRTRTWYITDPAQLAISNTFSFTFEYRYAMPTLATFNLKCF